MMDPGRITNACPDHPSKQKEFVCLTCKKIYCRKCQKNDSSHKSHIRPLSDELLSSYEFKQYLGAGTFGCVFSVISLSEDLPYALKVITDVATQADFDFASKETKLHSKMSHQNIIKYQNSFRIQSENLFVIQLELADSSLESELKCLSQKTAFSYFIQIIEALRYLHDDLTIAHRDLKPRNILIKNSVIKLCDMGEAKILNKNMLTLSNGRGFGTTIYLPPEVVNGQKYNEKSDVWAAGVVFHAMLSQGKHPFDSKGNRDESEIIENVKNRNGKFDECIQEPIFLKILESSNILYFILFNFDKIDCMNFDESERFSALQILKLIKVNYKLFI